MLTPKIKYFKYIYIYIYISEKINIIYIPL